MRSKLQWFGVAFNSAKCATQRKDYPLLKVRLIRLAFIAKTPVWERSSERADQEGKSAEESELTVI